MPRPRGFDIDDVLTKAMHVFWDKGYLGTSVKDLVVATGLNKGSLYGTFQDKQSLFAQSLRHYMDWAGFLFQRTPDAVADIRNFFTNIIAISLDPDQPGGGCFLMNTAMETDSLENEELKEYVVECLQGLENFFYQLLVDIKAQGQLVEGTDLKKQAQVLVGTAFSIRGLSKTFPNPTFLRNMADGALKAILVTN